MTTNSPSKGNFYITDRLAGVFARTALPIIFIMTINGVFVLVDAFFLGFYAGPDALSAVTLIFPLMMLLLALQTLVSNGMASIMARRLGAGDVEAASEIFSAAHILAIGTVATLYAVYFLWGGMAIDAVSDGSPSVAANAKTFMGIAIAFAPVGFFLSLNIDALRCEGHIGIMTIITVAATLLNILLNWLLMGIFHWGVAGSAFGTVFAQMLCLAALLAYRFRFIGALRYGVPKPSRQWWSVLALGAPMSLGFIGISLASASVIANLQIWQTTNYVSTVAAYGIITRILTFAYLPLMGVNIAFQTICGNNYGAGQAVRTNQSLKIAMATALFYCLMLEAVVLVFASRLGAMFVDDPIIIAETARILPFSVAAYFMFGPILILSGFFQALGDAPKAALLGMSRSYLFTIPLTFLLPTMLGEYGIWLAAPGAEIGMLLLATAVLVWNAFQRNWFLGLFSRPVIAVVLH